MKSTIKRLLLGMAVALALPAAASADTVIDSLDNAVSGTDTLGNTIAAQSFTTGSQAQVLQSVTLNLVGGTGTDTVSLMYDNAGIPGSTALSLGTVTPNVSGNSLYPLIAPSTFTLLADTTYWVAVQYSDTATMATPGPWNFTNQPGWSVTGSGTIGASADYAGGVWTPFTLRRLVRISCLIFVALI